MASKNARRIFVTRFRAVMCFGSVVTSSDFWIKRSRFKVVQKSTLRVDDTVLDVGIQEIHHVEISVSIYYLL